MFYEKGTNVRPPSHSAKKHLLSRFKGDLLGKPCSKSAGAMARGWVLVLAVCICGLALSSTPAWAVEGHTFATSFAGSGASALSKPKGLAINQKKGEVYVVDSANSRVEIFSSSGTFVKAFGKAGTGNGEFKEPTEIAVDNSGGATEGDVYVVDSGNKRVEIFSADGVFEKEVSKTEINAVEPKSGLEAIESVAIDGGGDLWIYVRKNGKTVMYEHTTGGSLMQAFENTAEIGPGLAVSASGHLWAGNSVGASQYGPAGEKLEGVGFTTGEFAGHTQGLALDPTNQDVYLDRGVEVAHFPAPTASSEGRSDSFGSSGSGKLSAGSGIAVDGATHDVYVADSAGNRVDVYSPVTLATASLKGPANVRETTAELSGEVNPEGVAVTSCEFEYGTEQGEYTNTVPCSPTPGSGTVPEAVSADLSGLTPEHYYARLSVTDANGTSYAEDVDAFRTVYALDIKTAGSGAGSVECEVNASGHFEACAFGYNFFTSLVLEANADPGSTFQEWTAGSSEATKCNGAAGSCGFEMVFEPASITAVFSKAAVTEYPLTVAVTGSGSGTVACEVEGTGITEEPCATKYPEGTALVLKAAAGVDSTFTSWSGACAGSDTECKLAMSGPQSVSAEFSETLIAKYSLNVSKTGDSTVISSPAGIDCGSTCTAEFDEGQQVTLTANPEPLWRFKQWTGCASTEGVHGEICKVTMSKAVTVTAEAEELPSFTLEVKATGKGEVVSSGTIKCKEGGTAGECSEEVQETQNVKLEAKPEPGWKFEEWSGTACNGGDVASTCEFAMPSKAVTVEAKFAEIHMRPLTVFITGEGEVESTPAGIKCKSEECTSEFEGEVTLTEKPKAVSGYEFGGWIGCRKATAATCTIDVTAASEVTAVFLKAGTEGSQGSTGPQGPKGEQGATGTNGANGKDGAQGQAGTAGAAGAAGSQGEKGATGSGGPAGPAGVQGPQGPAGPVGKVELVTCTRVKHNGKSERRCTTKLVSGLVTFTASAARATLSRHGLVYGAGTARIGSHGRISLRVLTLRRLRSGRYTLTLITGRGRDERIRSQPFTLATGVGR
jgi:DNA-binding beta-propeller fold protein YncE